MAPPPNLAETFCAVHDVVRSDLKYIFLTVNNINQTSALKVLILLSFDCGTDYKQDHKFYEDKNKATNDT